MVVPMTPVLPQTRLLFALGTVLTAGTGATLVLFPGHTDEFWAWPIAAAPSAAFLGAGYVGAAVSLALAGRERAWANARLIAVLAFVLTTTALLVTLRDLAPFELGTRGPQGVIAWTWLAVYAALRPLALAAIVRQERAGGRSEYRTEPARAMIRLGVGATGLAVGLYGLSLLLDLQALVALWPWPLTRLTAGVVGVWLLTYGVGFGWFALRDPSWQRIRIGAAGLGVALALHLVSAARLWNDVDGGAARAVYVGALVAVVAAIAAAAAAAGRVRRASPPAPGAHAAAP
jgi:MFS family permease